LPDPLFSLSDLASVKQSGGLNNDWDLTFLVICLLYSLVSKSKTSDDRDTWQRYQKTITHCDVKALTQFLRSTDIPLSTMLEQKGKIKDEFIASLYRGDVGSGNIIKQIFQEIYLGKDLFESTYGIPVKVYRNEGYINREKLLIDKSVLSSLSKDNILAIATGRPKAEAYYPLDFFELKDFFSIIYTLDDCLMEEKRILHEKGNKVSLSKPNPFMLDAIAETNSHEVSKLYYVGDMPDDMVAVSRSKAGFIGVGILISSPEKDNLKKELVRAGADYIIEDMEELKRIIKYKTLS
jgi:phosphoglycolate phosphatase-like HAD superfamily hydrolase